LVTAICPEEPSNISVKLSAGFTKLTPDFRTGGLTEKRRVSWSRRTSANIASRLLSRAWRAGRVRIHGRSGGERVPNGARPRTFGISAAPDELALPGVSKRKDLVQSQIGPLPAGDCGSKDTSMVHHPAEYVTAGG